LAEPLELLRKRTPPRTMLVKPFVE